MINYYQVSSYIWEGEGRRKCPKIPEFLGVICRNAKNLIFHIGSQSGNSFFVLVSCVLWNFLLDWFFCLGIYQPPTQFAVPAFFEFVYKWVWLKNLNKGLMHGRLKLTKSTMYVYFTKWRNKITFWIFFPVPQTSQKCKIFPNALPFFHEF